MTIPESLFIYDSPDFEFDSTIIEEFEPKYISLFNTIALPFNLEQEKDPLLRQLRLEVHLNHTTYVYYNDILYKKSALYPLGLCIPAHLRTYLMNMFHNSKTAGHVGRNKMIFNIHKRYYWPNMFLDVSDYVKACKTCNMFKGHQLRRQGLLGHITATFPFEIVCSDIAGPFKTTSRGSKYVLVCMDIFTNWVEVIPLKTLEAEELMEKVFEIIILRHGCPSKCLTDQGRNYASKLFKLFCEKLEITKLQTTAWHPQNVCLFLSLS